MEKEVARKDMGRVEDPRMNLIRAFFGDSRREHL
jgi:hypothetical protein